MSPVRLGAVGYLNARPLVFGLEHADAFTLRFDVPSRCATLLHAGDIDLGLIPSIEYVRGPSFDAYRIVPGLAIASRGAVASVALYTTRPLSDVRAIALDTSSRTSVALVRVLCARAFHISPDLRPHQPDLTAMLATADAALVIGDNALFANSGEVEVNGRAMHVEKLDLGSVWADTTGLPFVYAFWAGRPGIVEPHHVAALQGAKREGLAHVSEIAASYFAGSAERQAIGAGYLRDNIRYELGDDERGGLERFYAYAAEAGVIERAAAPRFY
jgi:chorismate dehydratase